MSSEDQVWEANHTPYQRILRRAANLWILRVRELHSMAEQEGRPHLLRAMDTYRVTFLKDFLKEVNQVRQERNLPLIHQGVCIELREAYSE